MQGHRLLIPKQHLDEEDENCHKLSTQTFTQPRMAANFVTRQAALVY